MLALATATALAAVPLLRPTNVLPETDHEWAVSRQLARPLLDDLGARLDELRLPGPVLIDLGAVRHVRYTLLAELQQRDIEFVFAAGIDRPLPVRRRAVRRRNGRVPTDPARRFRRRAAPWTRHAAGVGARTHR